MSEKIKVDSFFNLCFVIMCQFCVFSFSNVCFDRLGFCGSLWSRVIYCCILYHLSSKKISFQGDYSFFVNCKNYRLSVFLQMNYYEL